MTKRTRVTSGAKSKDELERDLKPSIKLPSLKLCIANSSGISCYSKKGAGKEKLRRLKRELYVLNLLNRLLRLGIRNKLQVLALSRLKVGPNVLNFFNEESNEGPVSWLAQSKLSKLSRQLKGRVSLSNDIFNVMDTFFVTNFVTNSVTNSGSSEDFERRSGCDLEWTDFNDFYSSSYGNSSYSESRESLHRTVNKMLSNLKDNKLCNGNDATHFTRFFLSFLLVNRFDFLSPSFLNSLLSNFYF